MLCVECLGPATITVVHSGYPIGTWCQGCYDAACRWGEQIQSLLADACAGLTMTPASELPATLRGSR